MLNAPRTTAQGAEAYAAALKKTHCIITGQLQEQGDCERVCGRHESLESEWEGTLADGVPLSSQKSKWWQGVHSWTGQPIRGRFGNEVKLGGLGQVGEQPALHPQLSCGGLLAPFAEGEVKGI